MESASAHAIRCLCTLILMMSLCVFCEAVSLLPCKMLLGGDARFAGCQELGTGQSAIMWAANGSDAITVKYMMVDNQNMGWMGLGLNVLGSMKGADMWIVHRQGAAWAVTDALAFAFAHPIADKSQDVVLRSMEFQNGVWSAVLSRKLKPCDLSGDMEIVPGATFVMLWAHGIVASNNFQGVTYHGLNGRGSTSVTLLAEQVSAGDKTLDQTTTATAGPTEAPPQQQASTAEIWSTVSTFMQGRDTPADGADSASASAVCRSPACDLTASTAPATEVNSQATKYTPPAVTTNPDGTLSVEIRCPRSPLPAAETTYLVCYVQVPNDQKYHIIRYDSIWSSPLVHHSTTYVCQPGSAAEEEAQQLLASSGTGPYNLDTHEKRCAQLYMVAPHRKAPPYTLPEVAGLPMGKGSYTMFVVEMHYYNPTRAAGRVDPGSGLRLTFQPASIRSVDAGFLSVGQFDLNIPPGQANYVARTATCTPGCTKRFTQNLTIIDQMLHGHYLSKTFRTSWVRNGVELKPLASMKRNDLAYQQWLPTGPVNNVLMPGDQLQLTCIYNSRSRTNVTQWGWGGRDEMCFWYVMYYPAQPSVAFCSQGFNDLLPMTICTDTNKDLTDIYEAYVVRNNVSEVARIVQDALKAGRGIMPDPIMEVTKRYSPAKGCSAVLP